MLRKNNTGIPLSGITQDFAETIVHFGIFAVILSATLKDTLLLVNQHDSRSKSFKEFGSLFL